MRPFFLFVFVVAASTFGCAPSGSAGGSAAKQQREDAGPGVAARASASQTPVATARTAQTVDLSAHFKNVPGTFVLYDLKNDSYLRHDERRAAERFSPFSTFKIPNSLIGLETGVVKDADFLIKYDPKKYPPSAATANFKEWWQDQTLRTAIRRSAAWYYREMASRVGAERMKEYVSKFRYGNEDTSGGVDTFWLGSTLKISADEQVEFLKRFHSGALPVSERSAGIVREIITLERTPAYVLSGKTGSGPLEGGKFVGWFVGYLEANDNTYFFATRIEGPTFAAIFDERIRITRNILSDLGHLPKPTPTPGRS